MFIEAVESVDTIHQQNPYEIQVENQPVNAVDKTDGASKTEQPKLLSEPRDEYIPSGGKPAISAGIYRLEKDESGNQKIVFDGMVSAEKNSEQPEVAASDKKQPKVSTGSDIADGLPKCVDDSEVSEEKEEILCTVDTSKVDREIKHLKEEKKQIEQKMNLAQGDEDKLRELERQLSQVEFELSEKDNDAYRKQNATFTQ